MSRLRSCSASLGARGLGQLAAQGPEGSDCPRKPATTWRLPQPRKPRSPASLQCLLQSKAPLPLPCTAGHSRTFLAHGTWPQTRCMQEPQGGGSSGMLSSGLAWGAPSISPAQRAPQGGRPGAAADEGGASGPCTSHPTGASWQPQPQPGARPCPAPVVIGGG